MSSKTRQLATNLPTEQLLWWTPFADAGELLFRLAELTEVLSENEWQTKERIVRMDLEHAQKASAAVETERMLDGIANANVGAP